MPLHTRLSTGDTSVYRPRMGKSMYSVISVKIDLLPTYSNCHYTGDACVYRRRTGKSYSSWPLLFLQTSQKSALRSLCTANLGASWLFEKIYNFERGASLTLHTFCMLGLCFCVCVCKSAGKSPGFGYEPATCGSFGTVRLAAACPADRRSAGVVLHFFVVSAHTCAHDIWCVCLKNCPTIGATPRESQICLLAINSQKYTSSHKVGSSTAHHDFYTLATGSLTSSIPFWTHSSCWILVRVFIVSHTILD